jgi:hypothetical protein
VLLEWALALRLEELGVVQSIVPVLLGKPSGNGDGTLPVSYFSHEEEWGGRNGYSTMPHRPTAAKEQFYMSWWEEQVVTQVAAQSAGVLGCSEIAELSAQLGGGAQGQGGLSAAQISSAFGADAKVDAATFLQWWRGSDNPRSAASQIAPKTVKQTVEGIKGFQGLGCHNLRRSGAEHQDELLGGTALVQEVAKRVLKVASEATLLAMDATAATAAASSSSSPREPASGAAAENGVAAAAGAGGGGAIAAGGGGDGGPLAAVPVHVLQAELERRRGTFGQ